ncbi:YdbL family protein, partial [Escherichia coli]|nr:YdbL family protein [Escherichia coli]
IQRKRQYTQQATTSSTVEQMAFVTGCNLISRTAPGEKYRAPDGRWLTRGGDAPVRDARCL